MNILYFPRWHFHYRLYLKIAKANPSVHHYILKYGSPSFADIFYKHKLPNVHYVYFENSAPKLSETLESPLYFDDPLKYSELLKYISADIYISYFRTFRSSSISSYSELLTFSNCLYQYFNQFLLDVGIVRVVSELVGGLPDGILNLACNDLSIPYLSLRQSKLTSGVIISNPLIDSPQSCFELPADLIVHSKVRKNFINHVPAYTKYTFKHPFVRLFRKTLFTDLIFFFFWVHATGASMMHNYQINTILLALSRALRSLKYYHFYRDRSFAIPSNSDCKYLLYPLHYEPESSVLVRGYPYNRQTDLINRISQHLPPNHILLVKEHNGNPGYRKSSDYRFIRSLPNVILVPPSTSVKSLLPNLLGLITISGRIGFEFAERLIPVYLIGRAFYQDYPTVTIHSSFHTFRKWLEGLSTLPSNQSNILAQDVNKKIFQYESLTLTAFHLGRSPYTFSNLNIENLSKIILSPLAVNSDDV